MNTKNKFNQWQTKKLGDVINFSRGLTYSKNDEVDFSGTAVLRANNINLGTSSLDFSEIRYIRDDINIPPEKKVQKNSLIITTASGSQSHLGKVALIDKDYNYAFGGFMGQITPKKEINSKYLFYILTSDRYRQYINELSRGVNINNLKYDQIHNFEINVPSILEQERIVNVLGELFEMIEKTKGNAKKNLQDSHDLFNSYLSNIFLNTGKNWDEKNLGEIATVEYGFTDKAMDEGDFRYIRITDIDKNGSLINDEKKYIKSSREAEKFVLKDNDLLMARTGATFAKVLLYKNIEKSVFASYLIRINFTRDIDNELYWYFSKTKLYWNQANSLSSGSAQPQFNGAALKEVIFPFPTLLEEQKDILKKVAKFSEHTRRLEEIYKQKLADLEELKKSILAEAFSGKL